MKNLDIPCCYIPCEAQAEYEVVWGGAPDDYSLGCKDHYRELVPDGHEAICVELASGLDAEEPWTFDGGES